MKRLPLSFWFIALLLISLLAGCGSNAPTPDVDATVNAAVAATAAAQPADTATPVPSTAIPTPANTPTPASMAVASLDDVQKAVIQIEAQGTFVDPAEGLQLNAAGRGSGFIIDESGIAVTNNHVVTGAALLKVWVGGEKEPRNARILGVSECSDLAVIDIEGDGYPFLNWYRGDIKTGLDVYAAGFPLGDPEFTLTRGIVSKAHANGDTNWASVDSVLEHDATINPGNSGGALVTQDGQVVGINYAGASSTNQYFAISNVEAQKVVAQLRQGQDVYSIGVNGTAVNDGQSLYGIWVASVKSGSPADKTGIKAGDIITQMEGLVLATDGTMADYCDILRTHSPQDTLNVSVLRFDTQEVLEGQLNGRPLEQSFSFAQELGGQVADSAPAAGNSGNAGGGSSEPAADYQYTVVTDNSQSMQLEIPTAWSDVDGSTWDNEGTILGGSITAAPNVNEFWDTYTTPGVFFAASEPLASAYDDTGSLLDELSGSLDCQYDGRKDYSDNVYTGVYDLYSNCGGDGGSVIVSLAAQPADGSFMIWLTTQIIGEADLNALDHLLNSFDVIGTLPGSTGGQSSGGGQSQDTGGGNDIPADWFPPAGQATIVIENKASMDLTFTMANIETKLVSGTTQVVYYPAGKHTFTAAAPGFDSQNSECTLNPDTIYYYVSDDSSWGNCVQIYP